MGEFDDLDPADLARSAAEQRERLQRERSEADGRAAQEARRQAEEQATALAQATQRTVELFEFLRKAFHGNPMSIKHNLVVERTGSRPAENGMSRVGEIPGWIVVRADSQSTSARHRPLGGVGNPEHVLAARCGVQKKYELAIYPIKQQDQPQYFATDDRDMFINSIQDEIARR